MNSQVLWYTTRATGVVALILLTVTVVLGVIGAGRVSTVNWPRVVTSGLHRNISLTALAFVLVHVMTTLLDPFVQISPVSVLLPFTSSYRPLWLSMGTVAFDMLLAVIFTSLLRDRLSYRAWSKVHWLVYACWPIALWHGLGTGTDPRLLWMLAIVAVCVIAVVAASWWRLSMVEDPGRRAAGRAALVLGPLATVIFVFSGPLQPGWALRAGTPTTLVAGATSGAVVGGTPGTSGTGATLSNASFSGHLTVTDNASGRTVVISGKTSGGTASTFTITLQGTPSGATGINMSSGTVRVSPSGSGSYTGSVTSLSASGLTASLSGPGGSRNATFVLNINGTAVTGQLSLTAQSGEGE